MAYSDKVVAFYHTREWQAMRKEVLSRDKGLCQVCLKQGRITPANTVHHIQPIRTFKNGKNVITDGWSKRLDEDNLESICAACHNREHPEKGLSKKQRYNREKRKNWEKENTNVFKIE
ncbi:HNH endonuclease [Pediococcus inopinatus]|uniref:HNH endonuclease n=1 Tax=Pediococcus inopinatus TaxID=114090 RepID=UPI002B25AFF9|nr:HNH endonuclease signature motif containing protein [Pediococcus inopinatus]WPC19432.1 HNH endonuclease [Pediococcus inopinatus]